MQYVALLFMLLVIQIYMLFTSVSTGESTFIIILLSAISLVSFGLFSAAFVLVKSIMKLVEYAVKVTCKKYLTEERIPDLDMKPIPTEKIDESSDQIIDNIVLIIRKKEGLLQNLIRKAAKLKAGSLIEDFKEFQSRNEYEQVSEKEIIHFMAEWKTKSMAEIFCRIPILMVYVTGIGVVSAFVISAYFAWFS